MRGVDEWNGSLFSYVSLEERIPARHPLRKVLVIVNDALKALDAELAQLYARDGRPSIPPERLPVANMLSLADQTSCNGLARAIEVAERSADRITALAELAAQIQVPP